ncbi:ABC transporter ATP-binding protein [Clostridium sp. chh4-2]|nr:ABC transporter ATP-binding protein [Clostridium sp. chh4-2]
MEKNVKLSIKNMKKKYKNGDGVENINIDVYEGEFLTMLGPSGCGKSTILRTLGGFLDIDEGEILIDGLPVQNLPPEKRPTAMVFQSYNLWPHMTVYDNLAFGLEIKKMPKDQIKREIEKGLKLVKMESFANKYPGQLSGGQQQRVAIARALLLKPSVLLLDEPFSALDAKIRAQMREELKKIQEELNITVVFVTHDQEEAMALSHRIVVMNKGIVEQIGTPTEIYDRPATEYVASFIGEMNFFHENDGSTIAVRPEDVVITKEEQSGAVQGYVRTIMVLGHYVEVNVDVGDNVVKTYLTRSLADSLKVRDKVSLLFNKKCIYAA